jgi:hypothetical protein
MRSRLSAADKDTPSYSDLEDHASLAVQGKAKQASGRTKCQEALSSNTKIKFHRLSLRSLATMFIASCKCLNILPRRCEPASTTNTFPLAPMLPASVWPVEQHLESYDKIPRCCLLFLRCICFQSPTPWFGWRCIKLCKDFVHICVCQQTIGMHLVDLLLLLPAQATSKPEPLVVTHTLSFTWDTSVSCSSVAAQSASTTERT